MKTFIAVLCAFIVGVLIGWGLKPQSVVNNNHTEWELIPFRFSKTNLSGGAQVEALRPSCSHPREYRHRTQCGVTCHICDTTGAYSCKYKRRLA